jgi:hypothetical protein
MALAIRISTQVRFDLKNSGASGKRDPQRNEEGVVLPGRQNSVGCMRFAGASGV